MSNLNEGYSKDIYSMKLFLTGFEPFGNNIENYYCPLNTTILSQPSKKESLGVFLSMTSPPL